MTGKRRPSAFSAGSFGKMDKRRLRFNYGVLAQIQ